MGAPRVANLLESVGKRRRAEASNRDVEQMRLFKASSKTVKCPACSQNLAPSAQCKDDGIRQALTNHQRWSCMRTRGDFVFPQ